MKPFNLGAAKRGEEIGVVIKNDDSGNVIGAKRVHYVGVMSGGQIATETPNGELQQFRPCSLCMLPLPPLKMWAQVLRYRGHFHAAIGDTPDEAIRIAVERFGGHTLLGDPQAIEVPDDGAAS